MQKIDKIDLNFFSVEFVSNLHKYLQSVYDQLHHFDPTLSALFYRWFIFCFFIR